MMNFLSFGFWIFPQFRLILHLLDPDPYPGSQLNADPMRIRIRNTVPETEVSEEKLPSQKQKS
jgi:hypothetical protein